jgi:hypothetical protein
MNTRTIQDPEERFWSKVNKTELCWIWQGALSEKGYGTFSIRGKQIRAHRYSWELVNGKIADGLVIDHLCENKACVKPEHLEPVTNKENLLRGEVGKKNAEHHKAKTHCRNGHEYTEENTAHWNRKSRGVLTRRCKVCYAEQQARNTGRKTKG